MDPVLTGVVSTLSSSSPASIWASISFRSLRDMGVADVDVEAARSALSEE